MKKNGEIYLPDKRYLLKILLTVKFIILFVCISSLQLTANVAAQKVSLNMKEASFQDVVQELEKQTGLTFLYNVQMVRVLDKMNVRADWEEFEDVLRNCLEGTGLSFRIVDKTVVIVPQPQVIPQVKSIRITGVVKDAQNQPLPGATVTVVTGVGDRSLATTTDQHGNYTLIIPEMENITLLFSFVGMIKQEVKYTGQESINVVLQEDTAALDDVVITGYANIKKSSFTGSATQVKREDIIKVGTSNVIDILQVFDPSLRIMKNNEMGSDPNTLPEFYIRGRSSIDGVSELDLEIGTDVSQYALATNPNLPVFIMDGFEVTVQKIYDFDINRIKNITILKDAAATAIYGSRASNGVIVIETLVPRPGELRFGYKGDFTITAPDLSSYNLMDAKELLAAEVVAGLFLADENPGIGSDIFGDSDGEVQLDLDKAYYKKRNNILRGIDSYWLSQPLSTMFNHAHSVTIEGGAESVRFGLELNYNNQNGVMKKSGRERMSVGLIVDYYFKTLQIRNKVEYQIVDSQKSPYGSFSDYAKMEPYDYWKDDDGNYRERLTQWRNSGKIKINPLYEAQIKNFNKRESTELSNNLSINWRVADYLQFKGQVAVTINSEEGKNFTDPASGKYLGGFYANLFQIGELIVDKSDSQRWNFNLFGVYNHMFGWHNVNASLGANTTINNREYVSSHYRGFPDSDRCSPAYAAEIINKPTFTDNKTRLLGAFFTINYSFKDIYLFDGSVRFDGSSEFGAERKWASFWSIGTGLNIHNYEVVRRVDWLSMLRIMANIGETGKTNFQPYMARNTYDIMVDDWYPSGIGAKLKYLGNEKLGWERELAWNIHGEFGVFNNRAILKFDYYHKKTNDLITNISIPSSSGFIQYTDNIGEVLNRGFELNLHFNAYRSRDFDISGFINFSQNRNKIVKIAESLKRYNERVDDYLGKYNEAENIDRGQLFYESNEWNLPYSKPFLKYEEGGSLEAIYGMKSLGINPANGKEVFLKRDGTITYEWNSADQQKIGDKEPKGKGAFGVNARYKGFTLYTTFMYEFGGDIYNSTLVSNVENANIEYYNADHRVLTDRWQKVGDVTSLKSVQDRYFVTRSTSRFVQKNNTLTFNSLTVGYDFNPQFIKKIGLSRLNLQFNMKDIVHISSIKREMGLSYPFARTFSFTLNTGF